MFKKYTSEDNWLVKCLAGAALAAFGFFFHLDGSVAENLGFSTPVPYTPALPAALVLSVTQTDVVTVAEAVESVEIVEDGDAAEVEDGAESFAALKEDNETSESNGKITKEQLNQEIDEMVDQLLEEIEYLRSLKME